MIQEPVDPERVRAVLREVLAREGIPTPPREPSLLERWLSDLLSEVFGAAAGLDLTRLVLYGMGTFAAVLVVALVVSRLRARTRPADARSRMHTGERRARARELREQARAAEAAGDLALALRLTLFALVVALGEEGALDFHPAWTDRELLARGAPPEAVRTRLDRVLDELEPKTFGLAPAVPGDLRRLEALLRELAPEVAA